jgi:hypothetical protein
MFKQVSLIKTFNSKFHIFRYKQVEVLSNEICAHTIAYDSYKEYCTIFTKNWEFALNQKGYSHVFKYKYYEILKSESTYAQYNFSN